MPREMCINLFLSAHNVKMQAYCATNKASVGCWQSWQREQQAGGSTELPSSRSKHRWLFKTRRCCRWCTLENPLHPGLYRSDHSHQTSLFFLLLLSFGFIRRVAWWEARLIKPFYCLLRKPDVGGGAVDVSSKAKMKLCWTGVPTTYCSDHRSCGRRFFDHSHFSKIISFEHFKPLVLLFIKPI